MSLLDYKPVQSFTRRVPFEITKAVEPDSESESESKNFYFIENGVCFSSFSFDTGSFIPIQGLGSGNLCDFTEGKKFFIDIKVLPNLQVSSAEIKCEPVGSEGSSWVGYPNMIEIKPLDEVDDEGRVTKLIDGKTQTNCYVLIGYRADDSEKNGSTPTETVSNDPVQILDTNIILLASVVSGVPVIFPAPYFNGQEHINAINS
jgi:hypothetical protein